MANVLANLAYVQSNLNLNTIKAGFVTYEFADSANVVLNNISYPDTCSVAFQDGKILLANVIAGHDLIISSQNFTGSSFVALTGETVNAFFNASSMVLIGLMLFCLKG